MSRGGGDLKKKTTKCPYCGAQAVLRPATVVHGESAWEEYLYVCPRYPTCDAYVGVHKQTMQPKGTLANGNLRHKRIQAHKAFNQFWTSGLMNKWQAYKWMQAKFGLNSDQAHIGKFSEFMCDELISACDHAMQNNKRLAS